MKKLFLAMLLGLTLLLGGCAGLTSLFGEVKTDPAIIGMTGWWLKIGIDTMATPLGAPLPIPSIVFGRGTIFRVGVTESATIKTGDAIKVRDIGGQSEGTLGVASEGSLSIETKDTSKALEKMADIYSQRGVEKTKDIK